jgi:hypothetical protein
MADVSQAYLEILRQIAEQCGCMLTYETKKRNALLKSDEKALAEVLQEQQAGLMQLESLEKQRAGLQKGLGFGTMTAGEIEKKLPEGENKKQFSALSAELHERAEELKELNQISLDIAKEQLNFIQTITQRAPQNAQSGTYGPGSKAAHAAAKPMFEEKI